jgi:hypothetical protein
LTTRRRTPDKHGFAEREALMQFSVAPPQVVRSITQRWLLDLWNRARGTHPLPLWQDLRTDEVWSLLDSLLFCDVVTDGGAPRLLVRLHGKRVAEMYARKDFEGAFLDEVLPIAWRDTAMRTYREAIDHRCPVYTASDTKDSEGRIVHLERLILPFSRDQRTVNSILSSIETLSAQGRFEHRDLGNSPHVANDCTILSTIDFGAKPTPPRPAASGAGANPPS